MKINIKLRKRTEKSIPFDKKKINSIVSLDDG